MIAYNMNTLKANAAAYDKAVKARQVMSYRQRLALVLGQRQRQRPAKVWG